MFKSKKGFIRSISTIALALMIVTAKTNAQQKPQVGEVLYAVDLQDNSKVYEMKVTGGKSQADDWADETFEVERVLLKEVANESGKKKGGFKKFLNEVSATSSSSSSTSKPQLTIPEGEFEYKMTEDNTEDGQMMPGQFKVTGDGNPFKHGFFYEIGGGFYKEVLFVNEKNDLYLEDPSMFHTIYVVGSDKAATIAKAATMNLETEKKKFYTPDPRSGRLPNPAVNVEDYSSGLSIDSEDGEVELPYTTEFFYLPTKSIEGRNLMYNRDVLRVDLYKGDQLVVTREFSKGHKNGRWLEKVRNQIDIDVRTLGKLTAGQYQLRYYLLGNEPFFLADFEVYTIPNNDINAENSEIYLLRGSYDKFMVIDAEVKKPKDYKGEVSYEIANMPLINVLPEEKVQIESFQAKLYKDGQFYGFMSQHTGAFSRDADYNNPEKIYRVTVDVLYGSGDLEGHFETGFQVANSNKDIRKLEKLTGNNMPDGNYEVKYFANEKLFASAKFKFNGGKVVAEGASLRSSADPKRYVIGRDDIAYIPITYHY